jgi:hypothetical protein
MTRPRRFGLTPARPTLPIVLAEHVGEGKIGAMPLFAAITSSMDVAFDEEHGGHGGGGGPAAPLTPTWTSHDGRRIRCDA